MTITVGRSTPRPSTVPTHPSSTSSCQKREDVLKGGHEAGEQRVRRGVNSKTKEPPSRRTPQRGESPEDQREEREEHEHIPASTGANDHGALSSGFPLATSSASMWMTESVLPFPSCPS